MKPNIKTKAIYLLFFTAVLFCTSFNYAKAYDSEAIKSYNQAIDYSHKNDYPNAIMYFKKAALLDPEFTDAYFNLGSIYEYLNDNNKALEAFMTVFKNNPNDYESIYKIANVYDRKGEYKKALDYLSIIPTSSEKYMSAYELQKKITAKLIAQRLAAKKVAKAVIHKTPVSAPVINKVVLANFHGPTGIAKDKENNIYVANYTSNSIVKISPDGSRKTIASGHPINGPVGIAVDNVNNIYVANYSSNEILKISPQGNIGVLLKAVKRPYCLFIDDNILYISEQGNNSVIKLKI